MTSEPFELVLAAMALVAIAVLLLRGPLLARSDHSSIDAAVAIPTLQVGRTGVAISYLRPGGKAQFGSRIVDVLTDGEVVKKGKQVSVIDQIDGDTYVREVT